MEKTQTSQQTPFGSDDSDRMMPREKLMKEGARSLSNAELLAILLRIGVKGTPVVELAEKMLADHDNSLIELANMPFDEIQKYNGIGEVKALTLCAALELGYRISIERRGQIDKVLRSSGDMFNAIVTKIGNLDHEEFWAIYLDTKHVVINRCFIGAGGLSSTPADIKLILQKALICKASAIVIAHNPPSGSVKPSSIDDHLTEAIRAAADTIGLRLLDHIIVGSIPYYDIKNSTNPDPDLGVHYYSYHDMGRL